MDTDAKRILMLGAGFWHTAYYRLIREMGLYTIGMDKNPDAPAKGESDVFYAADPTSVSAIIEIAKKHSVSAILPLAEFGVVPAAKAAHSLGLPSHCTPEVAHLTHNKGSMRQVWAAHQLDQPKFFIVNSLTQARTAAQDLGFPLIIKPTVLSGARGVARIDRQAELTSFYENTAAVSDGSIIIEEFIDGVETSVEGIVVDGQAIVLAYADKQLWPHPRNRVTYSINYPGAFDDNQVSGIQACAQQATSALGLLNSPFHLEVFVIGNRVIPIECGARGGGGHIYSSIVEIVSGVNLLKASVQLLLDKQTSVYPSKILRGACYRFLFPPEGRLLSISGLSRAREIPGIIDVVVSAKPGDVLVQAEHGGARVGCIVSQGVSRAQAVEVAIQAEENIQWNIES